MMRWQAGRHVVAIDGDGVTVEYFQLLAWAATRERLIEELGASRYEGKETQVRQS